MDITKLAQNSEKLCKALLIPQNEKDMFNFLRDLMTESEMLEFGQRLDIAERLSFGQSYKKIEEETKASSTTIARVAKFLNGEFGGYKFVLEKLK